MRQQINLFQDVLIERKAPLHSALILQVLGGCLIVLLATSVLLFWQQKNRGDELEVLAQERTRLAAELQLFKVQNPPKQKDPAVTRELEKMRVELAGRRPLLAYFDRFDPGMSQGFSAVIEGLARYPYQGVWLTGIKLDYLGQKVLLAGSASRAELVPTYLHHLSDNRVLKGQNFASLKLERLEEKSRYVDFRLESEFGGADE